jgi:hypothetical protein
MSYLNDLRTLEKELIDKYSESLKNENWRNELRGRDILKYNILPFIIQLFQ